MGLDFRVLRGRCRFGVMLYSYGCAMRFWLLTLVIVLLGLCIAVVWPKSRPLSMNEDHITGYYRGIGLMGAPGLLGRSYFRVEINVPDWGRIEADFAGPGYNRYRGFYPDGTLREEGVCMVELVNEGEPTPDNSQLESGRFYRPDGTLDGEVTDGTGTARWWDPNGTMRHELVLDNYQRVRLSWWHPNGQLSFNSNYLDGAVHGPYTSYHANGTPRVKGQYHEGEEVGLWQTFDENGELTSTEEHPDAPGVQPQPAESAETKPD